jgi:hypothetical protein
VTLTSAFQKFTVDQAALTDPQIGIRIVTSGDAVIVGNAECFTARSEAEVRGLGPIFTTTAAVATDRSEYLFDHANIAPKTAAWYGEHEFSGATNDTTAIFSAPLGRALTIDPRNEPGSIKGQFDDGSAGLIIGNALSQASADPFKWGVSMEEAGNGDLNVNGVWSSAPSSPVYGFYRASTNTDAMGLSSKNNTHKYRNLRRYDITSYQEGKDIIDGLMT